MNEINTYIEETASTMRQLIREKERIIEAAEMCSNCLQKAGKILFCGNGGSAAEAQHLSAELMGRFLLDRKPLASLSLTVDTSALSAIGNDYGFENIFSRQLEGIGNPGDVLIGLSTSGDSFNILKAFQLAKENNVRRILFSGDKLGKIAPHAEIIIRTPSTKTNFIQEGHLALGHLLCKLIEERFYART